MEDLDNKIKGLPEEYSNMFRWNVSWEDHRKGYTLLHLLRPTIYHLGKENLDLRNKIEKLKKKEQKEQRRKQVKGNKYFLRSQTIKRVIGKQVS